MPSAPAPSSSLKAHRPLLWLVAIGFFMQTLDGTIVNTALPAMAHALGESPLRMQWVVLSYLLTLAILIPASGWLADRFGTRRVYITATVLFGLGSLLCAESPNLTALVAARVLQGIGGALLLPVGRLTILRAVPRADFLAAMSFVVVPGLIGPLIGPALGGFLVQYASWHWIFLINLPVAALGVIIALKVMPEQKLDSVKPFDLPGFILLAIAMAAVSLALDGFSGRGMGHASAAVLFIGGLLAVACYWIYAANHPHPLFTPRLFHVRSFAIGVVGNLFNRMGTGAMPLLIPLYLQLGLGYSPFIAGLSMVPIALAAMTTKKLVPYVIRRAGYRNTLITTSLCLGIVLSAFGLLGATPHPVLLVLLLTALGTLNSLTFSCMNTLALLDLEHELTSAGNSLLSVVMQLGMGLGVAVGAALLSIFTAHGENTLSGFSATFGGVGVIAALPAILFWQLPRGWQRCPPQTENGAG